MQIIRKMFKAIFFVICISQYQCAMYGEVGASEISSSTSIQPMDADIVIDNERQRLEQVTIETEKIKVAAKLIINETNEKRAKNEISELEAAKIIGEQNYKIEHADERLAAIIKESVEKVEDAEAQEESYVKQLVAGAQNVGARLLAPFKSGYGYTQEEKGIAHAIIRELDKQLEILGKKYQEKIEAANDEEKSRLLNEYNEIRKSFVEEIYEQQLITGQEMSASRKLFWGTVAAAGALVGGAIAQHYLGAKVQMPLDLQPSTTQAPEPSIISEVSQKKTFGLPLEARSLSADYPKAAEQTREALSRVGSSVEEAIIKVEPRREAGELQPGEVVITPKAAHQIAEFAEQVGQKSLEDKDVTVYGAEPGTQSYFEKLQEVGAGSKPSESALERKKQRETFAERSVQQQPRAKRTEEEQQKETAELLKPFSTAGKTLLSGDVSEEEIGGPVTSEAIDQTQKTIKSGLQGAAGIAQKTGQRIIAAEPQRTPEEEPLGGVTIYEGPAQPDKSIVEQVPETIKSGLGAMKSSAKRAVNPEEGGI